MEPLAKLPPLRPTVDEDDGGGVAPPLPPTITDTLVRANTAYLATVEGGGPAGGAGASPGGAPSDAPDVSPHLCLMRVSWIHHPILGDVLVLTSRVASRKWAAMVLRPRVAILVHDATSSITLYGEATVVEGEVAAVLKAQHLARHPGYEQFIVGENIGVIAVRPSLARCCDIQDRVSEWQNPGGRPVRSGSCG